MPDTRCQRLEIRYSVSVKVLYMSKKTKAMYVYSADYSIDSVIQWAHTQINPSHHSFYPYMYVIHVRLHTRPTQPLSILQITKT